jgi:shikimate kinase
MMSDNPNTKKILPATPNPPCTIVLVGMMVAGKSAVGRKLAARLHLPFVDSDAEIESAAGMTIRQFFETHGEAEFRKGERRVIARLLQGPRCVLSTGGGAFMDADTRALIRGCAISIWLKVDLDILVKRAERKEDRPLLLGGNMRERMQALLAAREPAYAEAALTVESDERPVDDTVERVLNALDNYCQKMKSGS